MITVAEGIDGGFELGFCVGGVDDGCKKTYNIAQERRFVKGKPASFPEQNFFLTFLIKRFDFCEKHTILIIVLHLGYGELLFC